MKKPMSGTKKKTLLQKGIDRRIEEIVDLDAASSPDYAEIEKLCRQILEVEPDDVADTTCALSYLSHALEQQGDFEGALEAASEALNLDPEDATNCYNMACALHDIDPDDEDIAAYLIEAVELGPAEFLFDILGEEWISEETKKTVRLEHNGRVQDRIDDLFDEMVALDESDEPDYPEIERLCQEIIDLEPEDCFDLASVYSYLQFSLVQQERFEDALDAAISGVEYDSSHPVHSYNMATSLYSLNPKDPAIHEWLVKAMKLEPQFLESDFVVEDEDDDEDWAEWVRKASGQNVEETKKPSNAWLIPVILFGAGMAQLGTAAASNKQSTQSKTAQ